MENASKALIIAGAILLAILLISLGIMIFNQAQDTVTNSGMTEAELTSFNNKFLKYEGNAVKGTMVKSMMQEVKAANQNASDGVKITVNLKATADGQAAEITDTSSIQTNHTYKVAMVYTNNRISTINVTFVR
jgi:hypothetical protein